MLIRVQLGFSACHLRHQVQRIVFIREASHRSLSVVFDWYDRRAAGYEGWFAGGFVRAIPAFLTTVVTLPLIYVASWIPWFA